MNIESDRAVTVALSTRLPFAFGWLVKDGECAMGLARGAHGHDCGGLFFRNEGLRPGDSMYRVMGSWMTWRRIPVPKWLRPVVESAHQPSVVPPQPSTYGNAAVAQAADSVEAPAHYRPGDFDPSTLPWQDRYPRYPSSPSASI